MRDVDQGQLEKESRRLSSLAHYYYVRNQIATYLVANGNPLLMPSLTIKNIPEDVLQSLRERAARERRSLSNQVIIEIQAKGALHTLTADQLDARLLRKDAVLARYRENADPRPQLDLSIEDLEASIEEGRL